MVKRFIATGDPYSTGGRSLTARSLRTFLPLFFIIYDFTTAEKKTSSSGASGAVVSGRRYLPVCAPLFRGPENRRRLALAGKTRRGTAVDSRQTLGGRLADEPAGLAD